MYTKAHIFKKLGFATTIQEYFADNYTKMAGFSLHALVWAGSVSTGSGFRFSFLFCQMMKNEKHLGFVVEFPTWKSLFCFPRDLKFPVCCGRLIISSMLWAMNTN